MTENKSISLQKKIVACIITAIVVSCPLLRWWTSPKHLAVFLGGFLFLASIAFIFVWQYLESRKKINSAATLGFVQSILIYALTTDFMKWGLMKILRLHLTTSLVFMEIPMVLLPGDKQFTHFFGQSYPLVIVLGSIEIAGAILILFRHTRLLGALVLCVMTINIIMLDFFYNILSPITEAAVLLMGILYLALQDREKVFNFFFQASKNLPTFNFKNKLIKNGIKISAVVVPMLMAIPKYETQYRPHLTGKYEIQKMTINRKDIAINPCIDSSFTYLYFDLGNMFILTNNYFKKHYVGHFEFNEQTRQFKTVWRYPEQLKDDFNGTVSLLDKHNKMTLSGTMGKDTFNMELLKAEVKNFNKTY